MQVNRNAQTFFLDDIVYMVGDTGGLWELRQITHNTNTY